MERKFPNKYIEKVCELANVLSDSVILNNLHEEHKIFQKSSHPILMSIPYQIRNMIEIINLNYKTANELPFMLSNFNKEFAYINGNFIRLRDTVIINKDEIILNIIDFKQNTSFILINFINNLRLENISDINLYIQLTNILGKLLKNDSRCIKRERFNLFIQRICMANKEVEEKAVHENPIGERFINETIEFTNDDNFYGITDINFLELRENS